MFNIEQPLEIAVGELPAKLPPIKKKIPVIPMHQGPIFPSMLAPVILNDTELLDEMEKYLQNSPFIGVNLWGEAEDGDDHGRDVYRVGALCRLVRKVKLPDGSVNLLLQGVRRYFVKKFIETPKLLIAEPKIIEEKDIDDDEVKAMARNVLVMVKRLSDHNPYFTEEIKLAIMNAPNNSVLVDLVAFGLGGDPYSLQEILETIDLKKRFGKVMLLLRKEEGVTAIQKKITDKVNLKVNRNQREYFLKEQLKVIRQELGIEGQDRMAEQEEYAAKINNLPISEEVRKGLLEESRKLKHGAEQGPEYQVTRNYLSWVTGLPWGELSQEQIQFQKAQAQLEKDHYGLENAKERILEFIAVRKIRPDYDGSILCFAGPPGVGKTSLGKSIAQALGRKFFRLSLGGLKDEAEIKGHRRTYVGAMPGKFIQAMKQVGVMNPVIMLDEIDKLCISFQGDPAAALLEVLDPEQNTQFLDHYLDIPFDLSKVFFLATANDLGEIPAPLLDRLEVVELPGYSLEEKVTIGQKWILPKQVKKHGLKKKEVQLGNPALKSLINDYARGPGIRSLEQMVAKLCRKAAFKKLTEPDQGPLKISQTALPLLLGPAKYRSSSEVKLEPGVAKGLAWTPLGGEILYIETIELEGKGLKLTGQMGDVMHESANLAYSFVKKLLQEEDKSLSGRPLNKYKSSASTKDEQEGASDYLSNHEVHIHLPAGAVPKDGPSAGITMAVALYSLAHKKRVRATVAMTGELSLTGKVLPIGGLKEKILAAKRAGVKSIIFPEENQKDLEEVPATHRRGLKFIPVKNFHDILNHTLVS